MISSRLISSRLISDGDGTNSVEQAGTEADCNGGAAAYQGWFEMFRAAPVFYNNPVQPGDAMSASRERDRAAAVELRHRELHRRDRRQHALGNENPGALTMVSGNNVTEATPAALTGGNAFGDLGQ